MVTVVERYERMFPKSVEWYEQGRTLFAGGVTHQTRFTLPFPIYIEYAEGSYKYDVDGNQILDFVMGNSSLIMGHSPPEVVAAIAAQSERGVLLSSATPYEVRWAEAVKRLMPSVERIRFTNSGTESTYLALRLARAYTGKTKIVKFHEHFHGWHDYVLPESGLNSVGGVPRELLDTVIVSPADISEVNRILSEDDDVAAIIVEAHGAHYGMFPLPNPQFLQDLREITDERGVVFIMDEVITGFRLSPGGAQVRWDIQPDLTTMAKVMGGGQPGAGVGGKAEIMDMLAFRNDAEWDNVNRVSAANTYSANPVTAAASIATLEAIATKGVNARADALAQRLKDGLNEVFIRNEVTGHAHGVASIIHVNLGAECECDREICTMTYEEIYRTMPGERAKVAKTRALRQAMLVNGVDIMGGHAFMVSSAHDEGLVDQALDAFSQSLKDLRNEGAL